MAGTDKNTRVSKVTDSLIADMVRMRKDGWSYKHIGRQLNVGADTVRKYAPFGETTRMNRDTMQEFTEEMTAVGWEIVARLKREGRWKE